MDGEPEESEGPVDDGGGDHKARVEGAAHDAAERVPALIVEPVPKLVEALLGEEEGGSIVEVGVELVDHALVAEDAEEADGEGEDVDEGEDGDADQELLLLRFQLRDDEGSEGGRRCGNRSGFGCHGWGLLRIEGGNWGVNRSTFWGRGIGNPKEFDQIGVLERVEVDLEGGDRVGEIGRAHV